MAEVHIELGVGWGRTVQEAGNWEALWLGGGGGKRAVNSGGRGRCRRCCWVKRGVGIGGGVWQGRGQPEIEKAEAKLG